MIQECAKGRGLEYGLEGFEHHEERLSFERRLEENAPSEWLWLPRMLVVTPMGQIGWRGGHGEECWRRLMREGIEESKSRRKNGRAGNRSGNRSGKRAPEMMVEWTHQPEEWLS